MLVSLPMHITYCALVHLPLFSHKHVSVQICVTKYISLCVYVSIYISMCICVNTYLYVYMCQYISQKGVTAPAWLLPSKVPAPALSAKRPALFSKMPASALENSFIIKFKK